MNWKTLLRKFKEVFKFFFLIFESQIKIKFHIFQRYLRKVRNVEFNILQIIEFFCWVLTHSLPEWSALWCGWASPCSWPQGAPARTSCPPWRPPPRSGTWSSSTRCWSGSCGFESKTLGWRRTDGYIPWILCRAIRPCFLEAILSTVFKERYKMSPVPSWMQRWVIFLWVIQ